MPITWRTVTQPNQGAANRLAASGVDTILGGLDGLSKAFQAPQKRKAEADKLAFDQAVKQQALDQGQARIDNNASQFDARQAAALTAAELANDRKEAAAVLANSNANTRLTRSDRLRREQFDRELTARAPDLNKGSLDANGNYVPGPREKFLADQKLRTANAKGNGKSPKGLQSFNSGLGDIAGDQSVEAVKNRKAFASYLGERKDISQGQAEGLLLAAASDGGFFGAEVGKRLKGVTDFKDFITEFEKNSGNFSPTAGTPTQANSGTDQQGALNTLAEARAQKLLQDSVSGGSGLDPNQILNFSNNFR